MTKSSDRDELLGDVAEMYYQEGKTQSEISNTIGVTRSAISRMLTEARQKGIVEIHVHRPLQYQPDIQEKLIEKFNLQSASVIKWSGSDDYKNLRHKLGQAAAYALNERIKSDIIIGVAWGTTVQATIEAFDERKLTNTRVVQLTGVLGSTRHPYSGQTLVESLASKLNGEGIYLNTPFMVEKEDTAKILMNDQSVREAISLARQCDIALLGVGSTKPEYFSLLKGQHITQAEFTRLLEAQAVGDVSGHYFDISGNLVDVDFHKRLVGITKDDLLNIPIRLAVAGNAEKAEAILGAVCGGFINNLVTDHITAARVLEIAKTHCD
ncbi:MAG: sugar-binding transcriptional regulator [Chloroflexota bacterium]